MASIKTFLTAIVLLACLSAAAAGQRSTPEQVVRAFYAYDGTHSQVFNRRNIDARRKWMESTLHELFVNELAREKEYLKANPTDKPHFGDGLPFRPLDETCKVGNREHRYAVTVGKAEIMGATATVPVNFSYPKQCGLPTMVYRVKLIEVKTDWLIVDFQFPGGESLLDDLKRASY